MENLNKDMEDIRSEISRLRTELSAESKDTYAKLQHLQVLYSKQDYWQTDATNVNNLPGIRQPHWYTADVAFESGDIDVRSVEVNMSARNAFVCTQMQSYYEVTDKDSDNYIRNLPGNTSNASGRHLPSSSFKPYMEQLKAIGKGPGFTFGRLNPFFGNGEYYPELFYRIEVEGSGRFWASPKIPAAAFYGVETPLYLGMEGIVENVDKIKLYVYPASPISLDGIVRFVFHGYHIGSDVTLKHRQV